jgi:hypothetical protein
MISGKCDEGFALAMQAVEQLGMVSSAKASADDDARRYCPITGSLEERLERLRSQVAAHVDHPIWCAMLVAPARQAASEVTTPTQISLAMYALRGVAKCRSFSGHCDEARALWDEAQRMRQTDHRPPDLAPTCLGEQPHAPNAGADNPSPAP